MKKVKIAECNGLFILRSVSAIGSDVRSSRGKRLANCAGWYRPRRSHVKGCGFWAEAPDGCHCTSTMKTCLIASTQVTPCLVCAFPAICPWRGRGGGEFARRQFPLHLAFHKLCWWPNPQKLLESKALSAASRRASGNSVTCATFACGEMGRILWKHDHGDLVHNLEGTVCRKRFRARARMTTTG